MHQVLLICVIKFMVSDNAPDLTIICINWSRMSDNASSFTSLSIYCSYQGFKGV